MVLYPDVQVKARREIDELISGGSPRLPTLVDRPNLPYVNAIVKEVYRWNPSVPLGMLMIRSFGQSFCILTNLYNRATSSPQQGRRLSQLPHLTRNNCLAQHLVYAP
jgi:hypothetical protein